MARGTLGGAVAVAEQLPVEVGAVLVDTAREAFSRSLDLTSSISAVVVMTTAIAVAVLLRKVCRPTCAD